MPGKAGAKKSARKKCVPSSRNDCQPVKERRKAEKKCGKADVPTQCRGGLKSTCNKPKNMAEELQMTGRVPVGRVALKSGPKGKQVELKATQNDRTNDRSKRCPQMKQTERRFEKKAVVKASIEESEGESSSLEESGKPSVHDHDEDSESSLIDTSEDEMIHKEQGRNELVDSESSSDSFSEQDEHRKEMHSSVGINFDTSCDASETKQKRQDGTKKSEERTKVNPLLRVFRFLTPFQQKATFSPHNNTNCEESFTEAKEKSSRKVLDNKIMPRRFAARVAATQVLTATKKREDAEELQEETLLESEEDWSHGRYTTAVNMAARAHDAQSARGFEPVQKTKSDGVGMFSHKVRTAQHVIAMNKTGEEVSAEDVSVGTSKRRKFAHRAETAGLIVGGQTSEQSRRMQGWLAHKTSVMGFLTKKVSGKSRAHMDVDKLSRTLQVIDHKCFKISRRQNQSAKREECDERPIETERVEKSFWKPLKFTSRLFQKTKPPKTEERMNLSTKKNKRVNEPVLDLTPAVRGRKMDGRLKPAGCESAMQIPATMQKGRASAPWTKMRVGQMEKVDISTERAHRKNMEVMVHCLTSRQQHRMNREQHDGSLDKEQMGTESRFAVVLPRIHQAIHTPDELQPWRKAKVPCHWSHMPEYRRAELNVLQDDLLPITTVTNLTKWAMYRDPKTSWALSAGGFRKQEESWEKEDDLYEKYINTKLYPVTDSMALWNCKSLDDVGVDDMTQLTDLHEGAVLMNLKTRYERGIIYTYIGTILISVNPYQMFDLYGTESVLQYRGKDIVCNPPHLFALANAACTKLKDFKENQCILISGESGSGKTEATKLMLRYMAAIGGIQNHHITQPILEASPLLESFGNAKTMHNDNSSRFGKYVELYLENGVINGASTSQYLLEKSRIVFQTKNERNYHIFYELLAGLSPQQKQRLFLQDAETYFYLNQGGNCEIPGKKDREDFRRLLSAMEVLSFSSEEQMSIFKVLSSILQLGNVCFSSYEVHATVMSDGQSVASVVSSREIDTVADLLQVSPEGIEKAITFKVMETMREKIFSPLSVEVAIDARDAISKVLYSVLFNWLIDRINCQVAPHPEATSVAILDIYGFEDLTMNSFEQLCINYANEYLQFFFNRIIFKQEQEIYEKEKINWQNIAFNDNQPCLLLLSQRPYGILRILDDQSTFPQATDQTFLQKCHYHHVSNPLYCKPKMPLPEFSIKHYAGKVTYQVHKFLDKNHDQVRQEVLELFMQSGIKIVADEFREHTKEVQRTSLGKLQGPGRRYQPPTVAAKFSHSLFELMEKMAKCNSFFVRCLKPNRTKEPNLFELEMMSSQLRYSGIFETIRIRKDGYPIRLFFSTFLSRYKLLTGIQNLKQTDHNNCIVILRALCEHSPGELYQIGITRVFLKERLYLVLERRRERLITQAATTLQKHIRAYQAQRRYADLRKKVILLQAQVRGFQCRRRYQCLRRGLIRFRATVLMYLNRKKYLKMKEEMQKKPTDDIRRHDVLKDTAVDVSQMDIPVALAAMMDGSRDVGHIHDGKAIRIEAPEWLDSAPPLPMDINNFPFSKFVSMHFKKQTLGVALSNPPSTLTHIPEDLHSDAMEMLKMVIQFTSGPELHGLSEFLFGNHVVHKGLMEGRLRDELLCQLANEAERAHGANEARRGWLLLSLCLCVFTPSVKLQKYFLKYVSDHGSGGFAAICQRNLTHGLAVAEVLPGESRSLPPCLLEWHAASEHVAMALNITSFGGETILSPVDSWSRGEDVVGSILKHKGMADSCRGWSLALQENGHALEIAGHDYVLDLISFLEHPPAFQCQPPTYLGSHSPDGTNFMNNSHGNAETRTSMPPVSPITPNSVGPTGLLCQTHNTANLEAASQHHFDGYIDKMLGPLPPSENGDMAKASTMARRMKGGGDLGSNPEPPPTTVPSNMAPIAPQGPYLMPLVPGLVPSAIPTYQGIPASQQHNSAQQNMMAQQQALINQQAYLLAQQMVYQQMMCQQPPPPPPLYPPPPAPSAGAEAKRGNLHADDFTGDSMPEPTQNIRNIIKEYHGRNPQRSFSPEEPKIAQSRACPRPSDPHDQAIAILQGQRETPDIWSNPASTRKPHTEGKPVSLVTSSAIERSHETIARVKPVGISSHPDFTKMPPTPTSFAPATCRRKQSSVRFVEDVERGTPSVETAKPEKLLTPLHGKRPGAAYCYRGVPWKLVIRKEVFYPKQSFNHPAVLNLLFMQIVHDTFDERCQRVSPEERDKMKGLLETVGPNPQACDDERLKKRIVMAARDNWSCYFCRLFPATGSVGSEVDWLGVSHKGIKLLATTKTGEHSYLRVLQSYSYTDLQLVGLPERAAIQLVFHQDKLSLFSPRAAHAKHLIDHFLSELKKDSQYVVAIRSYSTSDSSLLRFHKGDLIKLLPMDGLEPGFYFGCLMKRTVIHLEDKQGTTEFGWHFGMRRGHSGLFPAEYVQTTAGPEPETPSESPLPCPHIDPDRKTESSSVSSDYAESLDDFEFVPEDKTKYSMVEYARLYFRQPLPPAPSRWRKKEPIVPPDPADLVKYNKSPIQRSLIESNEPKIDKMAADLFLAIMRFMGDYPLKGQKETDCIYSILKVCKECETMRDEVYCQLMKQVTANRSMKVDSCHRGWRLLYLVTAYTRCSETMQPYLLHTLHDVHNDPKASFQGMSRACIQHLRRTLQIGGRTQMPTITELRALVSGRNTKRQLILLPGSMERHVRVKTSTVVEDIIEELCIEMGLHHAEAWREYTLFLVMKRGDSVRPLSPKEYMLDISAEAEKVDENHRLWLRRVVWLQPLRLDNETYVRIHYHQVLSEFLKGFMMKLVEHISDEQAQSIAKLAALQHRTQCMAYPPTLREIQELIPPTFARLKRMEDWLPLVLQQHRLLNTLNPHQARSQFMGCSSKELVFLVSLDAMLLQNTSEKEIQLTYQMDEVQSTRTNRADSETSEPYVEIQLGDLLNQHITQLQLKQGLELCCVVAMHQEVILEVREQQIDLPSSDITLL